MEKTQPMKKRNQQLELILSNMTTTHIALAYLWGYLSASESTGNEEARRLLDSAARLCKTHETVQETETVQ